MKKMLLMLAIGISPLAMSACDPTDAAAKVFQKEGLHLLEPIRSYIEVGGLVVVPKTGSPYYVDRLDKLPDGSGDKPVVDFDAVLAKETRDQTASLGAATNAMQSLVFAPINFTLDSSQDVAFGQIVASGERLPIPSVQSLIALASTKDWIVRELSNHNRVLIVYEVYRAKQLSIRSTNNTTLHIGLDVGKSSTNQGTGNASPSSDPKAAAATPTNAAGASGGGSGSPAGPSATTPSSTSGGQSASSAGQARGQTAGTTTSQTPTPSSPTNAPASASQTASCSGTAAAAPAKTSSDAPNSSGISASWLRTSTYELSLCADKSYPFAVRLAEVIPQNGNPNLPVLQPGSFKFDGTLGAPTDTERFTAFVDKNAPSLRALSHIAGRGR
jgi:hypothetical protein